MTDLHEESSPAEVDPRSQDGEGWDAGSFITGILVGALVGAGVALLLAPRSGAATRRRIRRRAVDIAHDAKSGLASARDQLREKKEALRDRLVNGLDRVGEELGV